MEEAFEREEERHNAAVHLLAASAKSRAALIEDYRRRSEAAFAKSTLRNLHQIAAMFGAWCKERGYSHEPPVPPTIVAEYVDFLGGKIRPNTIEVRLWAIAEMHKARFLPSPAHHRLVTLALKGVKRTYGAGVRQAAPIGKQEALDVIRSLGNTRLAIRDKAALWIASDSWCRASEITALRVRDLRVQENGTSLLFIERSKTDQYAEGNYAFLSAEGTQAVKAWIQMAGLKMDDPILTKSQRNGKHSPLNPSTLSRIFKRCTGRQEVSAHSTRVGGVQDAFRLGCDLSSIMVAGRWTSPEMPARYGRRITASQSAAARVSEAFRSGDERPN